MARHKAWKVQPSPKPDDAGNNKHNVLSGVAATSSSNAWAVGYYLNGYTLQPQTLIEHWAGKYWTVQPSPSPGGYGNTNLLEGVAATSSSNAWAVGVYTSNGTGTPLIEHWDGTAWTVQPSPNPGTAPDGSSLSGVTATSATNAWAVGSYYNGTATQTLIEHWDGTAWTVQPTPTPGGSGELYAVAATSATNAWAVGDSSKGTLIEHWNGTTWQVQKSANPKGSDQLLSVAATSAHNAWAVGYDTKTHHHDRTLIEHWHR